MKILNKLQRRAAIWILEAFKTLPAEGIEAIAGIIPIRFHLQKIARRSQIHPLKLLNNHILKQLMDDKPPCPNSTNFSNIGSLTNRQRSLTKGHLIDSSIKSNGIIPLFSPLDPEFSPGHCIIDHFSSHFSFNLVNRKEKEIHKIRAQELDEIVLSNSSIPNTALVITNASIKNDIAISISHIHSANYSLIKIVHHTSFVTSSEAELFAIRCDINQACSIDSVSKIIIVTDSIHVARKIFNNNSSPF